MNTSEEGSATLCRTVPLVERESNELSEPLRAGPTARIPSPENGDKNNRYSV